MGAELLTSEVFGMPFTYSFGHIYLLGASWSWWDPRPSVGTLSSLDRGSPALGVCLLSPKSHSGAADNGTAMRLRKAQEALGLLVPLYKALQGFFRCAWRGRVLPRPSACSKNLLGVLGHSPVLLPPVNVGCLLRFDGF